MSDMPSQLCADGTAFLSGIRFEGKYVMHIHVNTSSHYYTLQGSTLNRCIREIKHEEKLTGENQYMCER